MPYIPQGERGNMAQLIHVPQTPGQLNYLITSLCLAYVREHGLSYTVCNEVFGALECLKQEMYRRMVAPYEDSKALDNGDIPWPSSLA